MRHDFLRLECLDNLIYTFSAYVAKELVNRFVSQGIKVSVVIKKAINEGYSVEEKSTEKKKI